MTRPTRQERKVATVKLKAARQRLAAEYQAAMENGGEETPEWQDANRAVIEAEKDVPWWRR